MDANLEKAALLLASIPESDSAALVARLSDREIEAIAHATASLNDVQEETQHEIAAELIDLRYQRRTRPQSTGDTGGSPEGVASASGGDERDSAEGVWHWTPEAQRALEQLQDAPSNWLARQLSHELPQTAAVVLCFVNPKLAAQVLAQMSTDVQIRVVHRIANTAPVPRELAEKIITSLADAYRFSRLEEVGNSHGLPFVAQIVARLDRATERALMENLAQDNRPMVDQLLRMLSLLKDRRRICLQATTHRKPTEPAPDRRAA